jgi:hypothetical protein
MPKALDYSPSHHSPAISGLVADAVQGDFLADWPSRNNFSTETSRALAILKIVSLPVNLPVFSQYAKVDCGMPVIFESASCDKPL